MPFCEAIGRRPMLIFSLIVFISSNIGVIFVKSFALFLVLRAIQAFGGAPLPLIGK